MHLHAEGGREDELADGGGEAGKEGVERLDYRSVVSRIGIVRRCGIG